MASPLDPLPSSSKFSPSTEENLPNNSSTSSSSWSLTIKTVGSSSSSFKSDESEPESTFDIAVDPNDSLYSLSRTIERKTGLSVQRQRLIYRGRILTVEQEEEDERTGGDDVDATTAATIHANNNRGIDGMITSAGSDGVYNNTIINDDTAEVDQDAPMTRQNSNDDDDSVVSRSVSDYISFLQRQRALRSPTINDSTASYATIPPKEADDEEETQPNNKKDEADDTAAAANEKEKNREGKKVKQRICDIKGLSDGHTIHLVPRPSSPASSNGAVNSSDTAAATATAAAHSPFSSLLMGTADENGGSGGFASISGPEGMNLLAALLGMSNTNTEGRFTDDGAAATTAATTNTLLRPNNNPIFSNNGVSLPHRSTTRRRGSTTRAAARAAAARLTEEDIRPRDPGSVEPVRQGLMTLHTLLGNALFATKNDDDNVNNSSSGGDTTCANVGDVSGDQEGKEEEKMGSMLEEEEEEYTTTTTATATATTPQQQHQQQSIPAFYTINQLQSNRQWYRGQWLDALDTVNQWLEATVVDIVLPGEILSGSCDDIFQDSPYSSDIKPKKGRVRRRTPDAVVSANDLEGRRRLLLEPLAAQEEETSEEMSGRIDEGYRQRPDNDGVQLLLIHYNGWPHRWDEWIRSDSERIRPFRTRTRHRITNQLVSPTPSNVFHAAPATHIMDEDDELERVMLLSELHRVVSSVNEILESAIPFERSAVDDDTSMFAPSTDTPHLPWRPPNHGIENALSCPSNDSESASSPQRRRLDPMTRLDSVQLRRLAPLIDRLGRTLTDAAPHIACLADSLPTPRAGVSPIPPAPTLSPFSVLGEESPTQSTVARVREASDAWASIIDNRPNSIRQDDGLNDPDLSDYINGMVNTSRNANRTDRDRDPLVSGLLSNYLSSQAGGGGNDNNDDNTLGRLIRMGGGTTGGGRNGEGPGIDIHIHAVVTGAGMTTIGGAGGGGATTGAATPLQSILRNSNASASTASWALRGTSRPSTGPALNEEDQGLFSELYSESPTPLNMHGSSNSSVAEEPSGRDLAQEFMECRSIEDESSVSEDIEVTTPDVPALITDALDVSNSTESHDDEKGLPAAESAPTTTADGAVNALVQTAPSSPDNASVQNNSTGSINTISEIGSVDSSPSDPPDTETASAPTPQIESLTSPSFTNRLFRRTLGRFGSNGRHNSRSSP